MRQMTISGMFHQIEQELQSLGKKHSLTAFELLVVVALMVFARAGVDIIVIEVGKLDCLFDDEICSKCETPCFVV